MILIETWQGEAEFDHDITLTESDNPEWWASYRQYGNLAAAS
jgi:hypothetical protein